MYNKTFTTPLHEQITIFAIPYIGTLTDSSHNTITESLLPFTFYINETLSYIVHNTDNYEQLASIPFKLCDSFGCSEINYLNLNVQDVNDPPIPTNPNVEGHYKQYETINFYGTDEEGDPITSIILYNITDNCSIFFYDVDLEAPVPFPMNIKLNTIQVMFYYNQPIHFDNEYKQYIDECVFYYSLYDNKNAKSAITRGTYSILNPINFRTDPYAILINQDTNCSFIIVPNAMLSSSISAL